VLLLIGVSGESVVRRAWIWWWYQNDYTACWWTE